MVLFGLINYEDYIFRTIATSNYARNALTVLLMYLVTGIVRFHLSVFFCWIVAMDNFLDLFIPILINVVLSLLSDTLYQYVGTHRSAYETLSDYLITHYSRDNMIRWKRYVLIAIFTYITVVLSLIDIDNTFMFLSTMQTAVSFIICDVLENKEIIHAKIHDFLSRPKATKLFDHFSIIPDYPVAPRGNNPDLNTGIRPPFSKSCIGPVQGKDHVAFSHNHKTWDGDTHHSFDVSPPLMKRVPVPRLLTPPRVRSVSPPIPLKPPTPPMIDDVTNYDSILSPAPHSSCSSWMIPGTPPRINNIPTPPRINNIPTPPRINNIPTPPRINDIPTPPRINDIPTPLRINVDMPKLSIGDGNEVSSTGSLSRRRHKKEHEDAKV